MQTKIEPISKTKTIDYGNELLENFWRQKPNVSVNQNHKNEIVRVLQSAQEGIVCIQTEVFTDIDLIKQIFDIAQNLEVRFYILVNEYSQELDILNETCLIRYEVKNKGSFVLVNPNSNKSEGTFFTGRLTEQSLAVTQHISRRLDVKETEELFRHFCYQFWEVAKKGVIEKEKKNDVTSKPLDVFHNINTFGGKDFVYGTLFNFLKKAKRNELSDKQIIYLNKETEIPIQIKGNTTKNLGDNVIKSLLTKNEFENQEPNFVDDGVSVSIAYKWQNIPFYLPENSKDHSLYKNWENKTKEIVNALNAIINKIEGVEKRENNFSKKIAHFFLGKKNIFGALRNEIDVLKGTDFANLVEAELNKKISRINEINTQVQNEIGEIEEAYRKAKLDEEIENIKKEILAKEHELESRNQELEEKKKDKRNKLEGFCAKYSIKKEELNQKKIDQWKQQASKNNKKDKKENLKEAELAEKKLKELNEIKASDFSSKVKDEIEKIKKHINLKNNEIKGKEKEKAKLTPQTSASSSLEKLFDPKNSKQTNSGKSLLLQVSDFKKYPQLPTIGNLFELNNEQFLAIEFWEQYEEAKKEAERLKAQLCVKRS
jgi:hypothetical protein